MKRVIQGTIVALIGTWLGCVVAPGPPQPSPPPPPPVVREPVGQQITCAPPHRLRVLDLDMSPDPVRRGQPIAAWRITIHSDWNGECGTHFEVHDQDQVAGSGFVQAIRPGRSVYTLPASPHYRFQRRDHCFLVQAHIGGTFTPIGAQRSFCAQPLPGAGWTLRER